MFAPARPRRARYSDGACVFVAAASSSVVLRPSPITSAMPSSAATDTSRATHRPPRICIICCVGSATADSVMAFPSDMVISLCVMIVEFPTSQPGGWVHEVKDSGLHIGRMHSSLNGDFHPVLLQHLH